MTLTIESNVDPSDLEDSKRRLFVRYEIGINNDDPITRLDPWKIVLAIIGNLKPIAGEVVNRGRRILDEDGKSHLEMWFLSRIPALPQDLIDVLQDPKIEARVQLHKWGWSPSGIKDLPEKELEELENLFNSNIIIQEFLQDEEPV